MHFAVGQRPDHLSVLPDIGDKHHRLVELLPRFCAAGMDALVRQIAEHPGKPDLIRVAERLAGKHQNQMFEPGSVNIAEIICADRRRQVDARDRRAKRR